MRETLFQLCLKGVVVRVPDVISKVADGCELRERFEQLCPRDRRIAQRRGSGNDSEEWIRNSLEQLWPETKLIRCKLIDIRIRNSNVSDLRTGVCRFKEDVGAEFPLDRKIPLLCISGTQVTVHAKHSLTQAGIRRWRNRQNRRSGREDKCRRDVV